MDASNSTELARLLAAHEHEIVDEWVRRNLEAAAGRTGRAELEVQCRELGGALRLALESGADPDSPAYAGLKERLGDLSRARALQGHSPSDTALFLLSLKPPLFGRIGADRSSDAAATASLMQVATDVIDRLSLYTLEVYQKSREAIIVRQQQELAELSTPVVRLWQGILALPLIGTLDSSRTQVVMENLLQSIVDNDAEIAIIDITGVPTVDTLVAQHLLKTVAAARLMGADCLISGIRPQIAQTMVHLGVELNVVSKASLADAFALALRRIGRSVVASRPRGEGASRDAV